MKRLLLATAVAFSLSACSMNDSGNALEQWKNYGSESVSTSQLSDKQALAVFYRTAAFQGAALNVYVNGDYQASLLEKSFIPVAVCANNTLISASYTTNKQFGNRTQGTHYTLPAKEAVYFRAVKDSAGNPTFEQVDVAVAKSELKQLSGANHTLVRVKGNKSCQ